MNTRHDSVLDLVGRTPVVRVSRLAPPHVELFVKLEARNPMGSVKDRAAELAAAHGWFLCRQFDNPANPAMHERTTGQEIIDAFADARLDWFVAGCGTGGTVTGVARALRRAGTSTRIAVCEPDNTPLLASGIAQPRNSDGTVSGSHPSFRPHPMQGWTPDFIAGITELAVKEQLVDRVVPVKGDDAMRLSRELARREGIFTGITGGATLAGALRIAREAPAGSRILALLPDTGERYQSTPLFADIAAEMSEEEVEISRSTPGARFDVASPAPTTAPQATPVCVDAEAQQAVARAIADPDMPVVMFALEWCEFCWSVRRLFTHLGIPFRSIDLDAALLQESDFGTRLRAALNARTGIATIPQIFIGGTLVGGAIDVIEAHRAGQLRPTLAGLGITCTESSVDPRVFLPGWLHPR